MHVDITFVKRYCKSLGNVFEYFWISFHDDIALLTKASLPHFFVFTLTLKNPFKEQDVSYLWESEEKVNQLLKIDEISKLIDLLLIKRQFSAMILSSNLTNSCL